ncbi:hypothetical protein PV04_04430 [Phialophora macrospora]|uniref:FAD-binding domain-containing protein n=1 Tax=Phialophora macrospora TaxID=1851006 RepID=A0A0D2FK53_9EURO|nr:hypothetical protein PV04_04430 [Phialophora macrospora]
MGSKNSSSADGLANGHSRVNGNGNDVNGGATSEPSALSLRVIVIGAGIGGLTAAIALRRQGHVVTLLEQSRFAQELGAAVHLAPNANGILRRLGIKAEDFGANLMERFSEYNADGTLVRSTPIKTDMWQHPWQLAHRVRLHNTLKELATTLDGPGPAAQLVISSPVVSIDCNKALAITKDGAEYQGDVLVGADGIKSITRLSIPGAHEPPFDSGKSAFRFMISRSDVAQDPVTSKYCEHPGDLLMFFAPDRRLVVYPTNDNKELNFVCIHPSHETKSATSGSWNNQTNIDMLIRTYQDFDPSVQALLRKADPATLKVWNLMDMTPLSTFVHGRMALIGDSAHPFLPHQGQGAGMAIEDAASLAVMLSDLNSVDEIPRRLELFNEARYERAHQIQQFSRLAGQDATDKGERLDMAQYTNYNFGHDEFDASAQRLRQYQWSRTPVYWRQPVVFGPMPGPRQRFDGSARDGRGSLSTTASIKFKTSRTMLQNLLPPGLKNFTFSSPGTIAYASLATTTLDKMEWLGGAGYHLSGLFIHGLQYTKKDGTVIKGSYLPILFESLTDPIVSGREELGMPKLFSSIDVDRRDSSYHITLSWRGAVWGRYQLSGLKEVDAAGSSVSGEPDDATFTYRYVPAVGPALKGQTVDEFLAFVPSAEEQPVPKVLRSFTATNASFTLDGHDWNALPTLHHIISRLAELPNYGIVSAKVTESMGVPDLASCRRIE